MADYTIRGDTRLDASGFNAGLSKIGGLAKAGLGAIVTAGAATATAITGVAVAGVKLASDLTEVQNVVDVTFGDNADKINEWAEAADTAYGLSTLAAKQYTGTLGAMLKSMGLADDQVLQMSTDMVGLAGDFASFYNLDAADAFEKIRSGISGETEPLKQLGINMSVANLEAYALSEGITKAYKDMTQAEQATLRYNYLMSVSADAQGDFVRTQDSLANQMRIATLQVQEMGAAIGSALLPMATEALKTGNEMLTALWEGFEKGGVDGLFEAAEGAITDLATWIAGQLPNLVDSAAGLIGAIAKGVYNALPAVATAFKEVGYALLDAIVAAAPSAGAAALELLSALGQGLSTGLPGLLQRGNEIVSGLMQGVVAASPNLLGPGLQLINQLALGIQQAIPSLVGIATSIITGLASMIAANFPQILQTGVNLLTSLISGVWSALPSLFAMALQLIVTLVGALITNLPQIIAAGFDLIVSLIEGMGTALPGIIEKAGEIAKAVWEAVKETDWIALGSDIIKGLIDGIGKMAGALWDAAVSIAESIWDAITGFFEIGSPSKLMRDEVGKMLPRGAAIGIEADAPKAVAAVDQMAEEMMAAAQRASLDSQTQAGTAVQVSVPEPDDTPDNPAPGQVQKIQNINFYEPVPSPDEMARRLRIEETYGLAGDRDE